MSDKRTTNWWINKDGLDESSQHSGEKQEMVVPGLEGKQKGSKEVQKAWKEWHKKIREAKSKMWH